MHPMFQFKDYVYISLQFFTFLNNTHWNLELRFQAYYLLILYWRISQKMLRPPTPYMKKNLLGSGQIAEMP